VNRRRGQPGVDDVMSIKEINQIPLGGPEDGGKSTSGKRENFVAQGCPAIGGHKAGGIKGTTVRTNKNPKMRIGENLGIKISVRKKP